MGSWHVIYTKPRAEKKVEERLNNFGIEAYCPVKQQVKQWSDRKKKILIPVLPSMVLVNIDEKERNKVFGQIKKDGCTVIPLSLYFNQKGLAKLSLGIAEGKRKVDKREVIKKRDWDREKHRILKNNN